MRQASPARHQGLSGSDLGGGMQASSIPLLPGSGLAFLAGHTPDLHMKDGPSWGGRSILHQAEQVEPLIWPAFGQQGLPSIMFCYEMEQDLPAQNLCLSHMGWPKSLKQHHSKATLCLQALCKASCFLLLSV